MINSGQKTKNNRLGRMAQSVQDRFAHRQEAERGAAQRHPDLFDGEPPASEKSGIDDGERRILNILQFCLLVAMGYFILGNIRPYLGFADQALFQWKDTGIFAFVANLPVIGWLLTGGFAIVSFAIGTVLWAVLQIFELLPTILTDSPSFILRFLSRINSWQKLTVNADESKVSRQLKEHYNAIPESVIETTNISRAIAYLLDAAICLIFYDVIEGGWGNLQTMFLTSDWSYIQLDQVGYIIATLFAVEALYWAYKLVTTILELYFENN